VRIRIGTRSSRLARVQTDDVARALVAAGHHVEIVGIKTAGDKRQDVAFDRVGTQGVFVAEIERALQDGRVDIAVHSLKDLPGKNPEDLVLAAVPERLDPADRLLVRSDAVDEAAPNLPVRRGARIGTASARREALLRHLRPDLEPAFLRGNLPTRIERLAQGRYDAILLAAAGIMRLDRAAAEGRAEPLGRDGLREFRLDPAEFVPAPAQGTVVVQARRDDAATCAAAGALDDPEARRAVTAERRLLARVEGGCQVPFGAWCRPKDGHGVLVMIAVLEREGRLLSAMAEGEDPEALAEAVWRGLNEGRSE
jgi:hydroxymethylbilane synthase